MGKAYMRLERPREAIPHLVAALPLDHDGKLHYQLARAYQAGRQRRLAAAELQRYRELSRAARAGE